MAKKKVIKAEKVSSVLVYTKDYAGYLEDMPEELRLEREERINTRKLHKQIFKSK